MRIKPLLICLVLVAATPSCGDTGSQEDGSPAGSFSSTIPVFGDAITWNPIDGLRDETMESLEAEAARSGLPLVAPPDVPVSLPVDLEATLSTQGSSSPGGTARFFRSYLALESATAGIVVRVASPPDRWCPDGSESATIRGSEGCWMEDGAGAQIWWVEHGHEFHLSVDLPIDEVVSWLDTWHSFPGSD